MTYMEVANWEVMKPDASPSTALIACDQLRSAVYKLKNDAIRPFGAAPTVILNDLHQLIENSRPLPLPGRLGVQALETKLSSRGDSRSIRETRPRQTNAVALLECSELRST